MASRCRSPAASDFKAKTATANAGHADAMQRLQQRWAEIAQAHAVPAQYLERYKDFKNRMEALHAETSAERERTRTIRNTVALERKQRKLTEACTTYSRFASEHQQSLTVRLAQAQTDAVQLQYATVTIANNHSYEREQQEVGRWYQTELTSIEQENAQAALRSRTALDTDLADMRRI